MDHNSQTLFITKCNATEVETCPSFSTKQKNDNSVTLTRSFHISLVWVSSLGIVCLGSLAWELSLDIYCSTPFPFPFQSGEVSPIRMIFA